MTETTKNQKLVDDNQKKNPIEVEALDFSADNLEWDNTTDHLDEIIDEEDKSEYDGISGLKKTEIFTKDRFFTDFFCQNMELAEALTGWVGLSVVITSGKPEIGSRETSDTVYEQCRKFRFLHWAIKTDVSWVKNIVPIMVFCKRKGEIVAENIPVFHTEQPEQPMAANNNNEPLDDTA